MSDPRIGKQLLDDIVFDFESGRSFEWIARRHEIKMQTVEKIIRAEMIRRDRDLVKAQRDTGIS